MAHEIFGERFLNHREPAWHGLGLTITDRRVGAVEALRLIGEYSIRTEPLVTTVSGLHVENKAVIREATNRGEPSKVLGVVGSEYQPVGPLATCSIYDEAVGEPVETIGALRGGAVLFVTVQLPKFDVKGDEVQDYLLLMNPMDGGESIQIVRTPVRVVCANTLRLGRSLGSTQYRLVHDANAQGNLHAWLKSLYAGAVEKAKVVKEACELLANYRLTETEVTSSLDRIYPDPREPKNTAPHEVMVRRAENREYVRQWQATAKAEVRKLYAGAGVGMDTPAAAGTAWGLLQGVTEYEDYRWARNPVQALESATFGERAEAKDRAFEVLAELAHN